ncbi:MAG: isoprenylcysteine carboxylmethyltransferase family protein [Planctomycetes bacterium]|nr:isoprenylcysteine carboxylmethyltransferase family protein [Planctomycetota bacterium]
MSDPSTYSGTRFSGWYLLLQAAVFAGWWAWLWARPEARAWFVPQGAGEPDLMAFLLPDLCVAAATSCAAGVAFFLRLRWAQPLAWFSAGAVVYAAIYCLGWAVQRQSGWLNVACMLPAALFATIAALDAGRGTVPIFRRAAQGHDGRSERKRRHVLATLAQIAVFWSFFLFVVPACVAYVERGVGWPPGFAFPGQRVVGVAAFALLSALGLASGMTMAGFGQGTPLPFDAPNRLVIAGPYAYLRNPMVVAGLGQGLSVAVWMGSWTVVLYVITGGAIWQWLVRPAEERDLAESFGAEYERYRAAVRCWLPRATAYRGEAP